MDVGNLVEGSLLMYLYVSVWIWVAGITILMNTTISSKNIQCHAVRLEVGGP